jgi:hypothetical protein
VAKLNESGDCLWANSYGAAGLVLAMAPPAVDGSGNVLVTGGFDGTVDFGCGVLTANSPDPNVFVAKLDESGGCSWSRHYGHFQGMAGGQGVAVDGSGNVVITGMFQGDINFGGSTLTSVGGDDIFVAKLDLYGNHLWSQRFGGQQSQRADRGVAVDGSGNVLVAGSFEGGIDFGGGPLTSAGGRDVFLAKLDPSGNHVWSMRFGDVQSEFSRSVAVDGSGNVLVTGDFQGNIDFGGGSMTSAGADDVFVAKFDPNGTHLWSKRYGTAVAQESSHITVDELGNVLVTGEFQGNIDFGGGPLTSAGADDVFLAKLEP